MNNDNGNLLGIQPMENYVAPNIPTLEETRHNPQILTKLPSRWLKNKKILLCAGLAGTLTLSACANFANIQYSDVLRVEPPQQTEHIEYDLQVRLHSGGGGSFSYVVHLTEQEAFNIIQTQLEAAGINFNAIPPDYVVDFESWGPEFNLELFDRDKGIAISHISWEDNNIQFFSHGGSRLANEVAAEFRQQAGDLTIGVFYTPSWYAPFVRNPEDEWTPIAPSTETVNASRPIHEMKLAAQAQIFIEFLQAEGILQPTQEISVILDGAQIEFDTPVFTFNNRTIVPVREMITALGLSFEWDGSWQPATASKDGLEIEISHSRHNITVNGELLPHVFPIIVSNNIMLVQLEYLVDLIGANMEWDRTTQTATITTN